MKKKLIITLAVLIVSIVIFQPLLAMGSGESGPQSSAAAAGGQAKYVFLFVGDGMAPTQVSATEYYLATRENNMNFDINRLRFTQFPSAGLMNTHDYGSLITDSASAGTAFATGRKTLSSMINVDPRDGRTPYKTIAQYAQEAGMRIGIVSNVTLTHATPAAFYGSVNHRNNTDGNDNEPRGLAQQLVESGFDYFAGGWIVSNSANNDRWVNEARRLGYTVTNTRAGFNSLNANSGKVIAFAERIQDSGSMHYEIDRLSTDLSLADFTRKGIELLNNPNGFFMMVESGKIDWAGTAGLPAQPGVSANLGMGYSMYLDRIDQQTRSFVAFNADVVNPYRARVTDSSQRRLEDLYPAILESFGIDLRPASLNISEYQRNQIDIAFRRSMDQPVDAPQEGWSVFHSGYEPLTIKLTHVMNQTAGIGWTSYSHTATPVLNFAMGVHHDFFNGYYDNTEIFFMLARAMGINVGF